MTPLLIVLIYLASILGNVFSDNGEESMSNQFSQAISQSFEASNSKSLQYTNKKYNSTVHTRVSKHKQLNFKGLFVLPIPSSTTDLDSLISKEWKNIEMPLNSYFAGFEPPKDMEKWKIALVQASRGEQILMQKVFSIIKSPFDIISNDVNFKWIHRITESYPTNAAEINAPNAKISVDNKRAVLTLFGHYKFNFPGFEGQQWKYTGLNIDEIFRSDQDFKLTNKIIGIGLPNENWGYVSTYFLNRTVHWGFRLKAHSEENPYKPGYEPPLNDVKKFLDDPNLVMLVVNQHHNCSHPKVISLPLGVKDPKELWYNIQRSLHSKKHRKKTTLLFSAGSDYAHRPFILDCVHKNMGPLLYQSRKKVSIQTYFSKTYHSMAVLSMPGLGYDTYRLWESLASGTMPVLERGMGMDRTFYKLPILLVDDYSEITEAMIRQAYVEALYRVDSWEYERMTKQYWEHLFYEVADSGSIEPMLRKHPMSAEDSNFTRPLVPFDCEAMQGGCGPGTKRTPKQSSCAIDPSVLKVNYRWKWIP